MLRLLRGVDLKCAWYTKVARARTQRGGRENEAGRGQLEILFWGNWETAKE